MSCNCMQTIDTKLAESGANTKIQRTYTLGSSVSAFPTILTALVEKKRGAKAMAVIPTYCPWCGLNYKNDQPAPRKLEEVPNG